MNDELRRTLVHEAERPALQRVEMTEVVTRAGRIRRRRRAALVVGAAAVVVAVVVPVTVGGEQHVRRPQVPVATPTPVVPTTLAEIPRGTDPRIPYTFGAAIHLADGTTVRRPWPDGYVAWTPYAGGYLVAGDTALTQYDAQGATVRTWTPANLPDLSPDGSRVAWVGDGGVHLGPVDGSARSDVVVPDALGVAGSLSTGQVVVDTGSGVLVADPDGYEQLAGLRSASDATPYGDLVATVDTHGHGSSVVSAMTGKVQWHTPDLSLGGFSPDGSLVWAYGPQGAQPRVVELLDARTGEGLAKLDLSQFGRARERHVTWEDDDHVLVVVNDPRAKEQTVLRFGSDGSVTRATALESTDRPEVYFFAAD